MKVANTRKVNERIIQYMSREQLNSLLGMGLSAPVSVDEIIFEILFYVGCDYNSHKNHTGGRS